MEIMGYSFVTLVINCRTKSFDTIKPILKYMLQKRNTMKQRTINFIIH